jgi:hypothetical protein
MVDVSTPALTGVASQFWLRIQITSEWLIYARCGGVRLTTFTSPRLERTSSILDTLSAQQHYWQP